MRMVWIAVMTLMVAACGSSGRHVADARAIVAAAQMTHCHAVGASPVPKNGVAFFPQLSCDQGDVYILNDDSEATFKRIFNPVTSQPTLEGNGFIIPCNSAAWCLTAQRALGGVIVNPVKGVPAAAPSSPTATSMTPTLGKAWAQGLKGYGQVRPHAIFDGNSIYNWVGNVTWKSWGGPKAVGTGYMKDLSHVSSAVLAPWGKVMVVAYDLGPCEGHVAYRRIEFPAHLDQFDPAHGFTICDPSPSTRP